MVSGPTSLSLTLHGRCARQDPWAHSRDCHSGPTPGAHAQPACNLNPLSRSITRGIQRTRHTTRTSTSPGVTRPGPWHWKSAYSSGRETGCSVSFSGGSSPHGGVQGGGGGAAAKISGSGGERREERFRPVLRWPRFQAPCYIEGGAGIRSPSNKKGELVQPQPFRATPHSSHLV